MFNYINCFYFRCVIVHSVYKKCDILEFCIVQLKKKKKEKIVEKNTIRLDQIHLTKIG